VGSMCTVELHVVFKDIKSLIFVQKYFHGEFVSLLTTEGT
jgi:hypothetical protein